MFLAILCAGTAEFYKGNPLKCIGSIATWFMLVQFIERSIEIALFGEAFFHPLDYLINSFFVIYVIGTVGMCWQLHKVKKEAKAKSAFKLHIVDKD